MRWLMALTHLLTCEVIAQSDHFWAIPTKATTIHSKADSSSSDVAQVTPDDVLLMRFEGKSWCWAQDRMGHTGYMHRSVVRPLTELDDKAAVRWMQKVFEEEERLGRQINERFLAGDSLGTQATGRVLNDHEYERNAALSLFTPYYCRTGDTALLRSVMKAIAANFGSASEEPPYRLTLALECRPSDFKRALSSIDSRDAGVVIEAASNGLWLRFDEGDPEQVKQREALMKRLHE